MKPSNNLEEEIEEDMKNEIRFTLIQEKHNQNNLNIAFVLGGEYKMKNDSIIALKIDQRGTTLISRHDRADVSDEDIRKVLQYGITRALGLLLKGEIMDNPMSEADKVNLINLSVMDSKEL